MKNPVIIFIILNSFPITGYSQTFHKPNFGLKSHETLEINKIESTPAATTLFMSIENRIEGGNFCADKNIYIIYPDGKRSKLNFSSGIPVCPDSYKFKAAGEKLDFTLSFPPVREGVRWIDLVEECDAHCFSIYGITLDTTLNKKIDEAYIKANNAKPLEGIKYFSDILDETDKMNLGSEGMLYINIIRLAREAGDDLQAKRWYERFKLSDAPRLTQYLKYLNDQGIKY